MFMEKRTINGLSLFELLSFLVTLIVEAFICIAVISFVVLGATLYDVLQMELPSLTVVTSRCCHYY